MFDSIIAWTEEFTGLSPVTLHKIAISILAIIVLWLLRFLIKRVIRKKTKR